MDIMRTVIRHATIISSSEITRNGYISIKDGVIEEVGREPYSGSAENVINAEGLIAMPGFIDTHTHGIRGLDVTNDRDPCKILEMAKYYSEHGVTSFLPTTVTAPLEILKESCKAVREALQLWKPSHGARILGIHLEGPYINPEAAGAQNKSFIRPPDAREFKDLVEACGIVKQVTIAPELKGSEELVRYAKGSGIVVSAGHTNASYEDGLKSIRLGVSKANHLFNGMTRFHHREPGIAIALLQSPDVYLEVIADFIHLHRAVVKMIIDYATPNRVVLITDSIAATDMPDGVYPAWWLRSCCSAGSVQARRVRRLSRVNVNHG